MPQRGNNNHPSNFPGVISWIEEGKKEDIFSKTNHNSSLSNVVQAVSSSLFQTFPLTDWHCKFEWSPSLSSWPLLCGHSLHPAFIYQHHTLDHSHDYSFLWGVQWQASGWRHFYFLDIKRCKSARVRLVIEVSREQKRFIWFIYWLCVTVTVYLSWSHTPTVTLLMTTHNAWPSRLAHSDDKDECKSLSFICFAQLFCVCECQTERTSHWTKKREERIVLWAEFNGSLPRRISIVFHVILFLARTDTLRFDPPCEALLHHIRQRFSRLIIPMHIFVTQHIVNLREEADATPSLLFVPGINCHTWKNQRAKCI